VDAFVFVRTAPGKVEDVVAGLLSSRGVRHAVTVIGDWDVVASVHGNDLARIAGDVLRQVHRIDGVERTLTLPVVPTDVTGVRGGDLATTLPLQRDGDACYVRLRAAPNRTAEIFAALVEMDEVAGVAMVAGEEDILAEVPRPWDEGARVVLEGIRAIPGVLSTNTLVAIPYLPEEEEDRDQFSAWS
jgi:DNA-binding Lrp family transcriptional regulator